MQPHIAEQYIFCPMRRSGLIAHTLSILFFFLTIVLSLWLAAHTGIGPFFLLYLLLSLSALLAIAWLAYQIYGLQNSYYAVSRDGIRIRWGLRFEDIPMDQVLWVHLESDLSSSLHLPRLRLPGTILGHRHTPDGNRVEFMASTSRGLVVVAASIGDFVISPSEPNDFLNAFQRCTEMGSLTPLEARSVYPTFLLTRVWAVYPARVLLLTSISLSLILLAWVSLIIPSRSQIHIGFLSDGSPGSLVPTVRLMLLPVINTFFLLNNLLLGLFFFRKEESQPLSYLLLGSGVFTPLMFLIAVFFTLRLG